MLGRVPDAPIRYRSYDEDSARWLGFPFRDGDVVISTRSKSGTTWMQMICALLVLQTPDLPAPLPTLSPWLDWLGAPRDEVYERLAAQGHRRFIKTHTPLDGLPLDERATYIVVARHPLDMAVSLYHHSENLDRERMRELISPDQPAPVRRARPAVHEWVLEWVGSDDDPREQLDSLPGVMLHLSDAWARRHEPNVVLVHYDDLLADLGAEMRRLAAALDIAVREELWPELVRAASFEQMRANADRMAPDPAGVMKSKTAFFRNGRSGSGRDMLSDDEMARYRARTAELAPTDLLAWLHRDAHGSASPGRWSH
jgi:aryl sulfotransferase